MSGFAFIFNRNGRPVDHEEMVKMMQAMAHRGPDASSIHVNEALGLGHLLLKTGSGTQQEQMPASLGNGRLWITGDLRLDDRKELWTKLGIDTPFDPLIPDSRLVLHAYAKWGDQCPFHLMGDFAFVLWDVQKSRILAARDPFGVKPFYFHLSEKVFIAASEMKALISNGNVDRKLDERWLLNYMSVNAEELESTIFNSVKKLPLATCLSITPEAVSKLNYWKLDPNRELNYTKESDYLEHYRELFFKANERRLDCTAPIGGYLSGGLDSSSIVCVSRQLLRQQNDRQLHTFSATFSASAECDESHYVKTVLSGDDLLPSFFDASSSGVLADFHKIFDFLDEPRWAYNLYLNWNLLKVAKSLGVKVILDGYDGDTVLSHGQELLSEWAYSGHWIRLFRELNAICGMKNIPFWPSYRNILWSHGIQDRLPKALRKAVNAIKSLRHAPVRNVKQDVIWLNGEFVRRNNYSQLNGSSTQKSLRNHKLCHMNLLQSELLSYNLEILDSVSSAYGIEPRYPFFDRELVEFCFAVPWNYKLHNGYTRVIARKALKEILPEEIRLRPDKANVGLGFEKNFNEHDYNNIMEYIENNPLDILDSFMLNHLKLKACQTRCSGDDKVLVWRIICLNIWLRKYLCN